MKQELHIYIRVSTEIQQTDGFGLENQRELGLKVSEKLGFTPIIVDEGSQSSSKEDLENRPKLRKLLDDIEKGKVKNVWVFRVDRLSRNDTTSFMIRKVFEKNNVTLYVNEGSKYDLDDPQNKFMYQIFESVSQFEQQMRTDRFRRGRLSSVKNGNWKGGPPPFGYSIENKKLVENKEESKWVKRIYEEYSKGKSIYHIQHMLMKNGVLSRRGNPHFGDQTIKNILQHTHYEGYYFYTDKRINETVKSVVPILITNKSLIKKVRNRLEESSHKSNNKIHNTLLSKYLVCGHCKSPFGQRIKPKQYRNHYYCRGNEIWKKRSDEDKKFCTKKDGRVRSINIEDTDDLVWKSVINVLENSVLFKEIFKTKTLKPINDPKNKLSDSDKKVIKNRIKHIESNINKLDSSLMDIQIDNMLGDGDTTKVFIKKIESRKRDLQIEVEKLKTQLYNDRKEVEFVDWVIRYRDHIDTLLSPNTDIRTKRSLLEGVLKKITVTTIDDRNHNLDIEFKSPYVGDELVWNNIKKRSDGYVLNSGKKKLLVKLDSTDKRTLPKKKLS